MSAELIIHVDGGARGNPGPAGAGVVIRSADGALLHEAAYFLGRQTNNAAEYHALIRALQRARQFGNQSLTLRSDSELLVRQITGQYRVKSPRLRTLFQQVQLLLLKVPRWSMHHVSRQDNRRADELANLAIDRQCDVLVHDVNHPPSAPPPHGAGNRSAQDLAGDQSRKHAVRVVLAAPPQAGNCPAGTCAPPAFTVGQSLPEGVCLRAVHALLPTLLAMLNTDAREFAALPTMTVRCMHPGCQAAFRLSPARSPNGPPRPPDSRQNAGS